MSALRSRLDFKFTIGRLRGVPCGSKSARRISRKATVAWPRDKPGRGREIFRPTGRLVQQSRTCWPSSQKFPAERATAFRDSHIFDPKDYAELTGSRPRTAGRFPTGASRPSARPRSKEDTKATPAVFRWISRSVKANASCAGRKRRESVFCKSILARRFAPVTETLLGGQNETKSTLRSDPARRPGRGGCRQSSTAHAGWIYRPLGPVSSRTCTWPNAQ